MIIACFRAIKFVLILIFMAHVCAGQTTYTSNVENGDWNVASTWINGVPSSGANNHVVMNHNINLNVNSIGAFNSVTLNNNRTLTSSASANRVFTSITNFTANGNITINGDLTLTNSTTLTINSGDLRVTGSLILSNGSRLIFNSTGSIEANAFSTSGGSPNTLDLNGGSLTINNTMTVSSGTTININSGTTANISNLTIGNNNTAIFNNRGTTTITNNVSTSGPLNNYGSLTINGNLTATTSSNAITTNSGQLTIKGNAHIPGSAKFRINPGGHTLVEGSVTVDANENLIVGTNVAPPPYADMIIVQNLNSSGSGDVVVNTNGRLAVFGDFARLGTNGGVLFTINNGGQVYIHGDIAWNNGSGGGNNIINNNTTSPYGLYVNGTVQNSNGTTTSNIGDQHTMATTNSSFTNWVASQPHSPIVGLPVTLLNFYIKKSDKNSVQLIWATASEQDNSHFIIQRCEDLKSWEEIGIIEGSGTSTQIRHYQFTDSSPIKGVSYYRLKQVDYDGAYEIFTPVQNKNASEVSEINFFPNPTTDFLNIRILSDFTEKLYEASLYDLSGNLVKQEISLSDSFFLDLTNLQRAAYILKISAGTELFVKKIIRK